MRDMHIISLRIRDFRENRG